MDYTVTAYIAYLVISIGLTVWVAQTLRKAGKVFLVDVFKGNEELSSAVNHLLVVGFYLLNLGFVALFMQTDRGDTVYSAAGTVLRESGLAGSRQIFETVAQKVGIVLLVLGVLHMCNLFILNKFRRRSLSAANPNRPVPPTTYTRRGPGAPMGPGPQQGNPQQGQQGQRPGPGVQPWNLPDAPPATA